MGDHLKKARLLRGLVQDQVARELGVSGTTLLNWETGKTAPRAYLRERIVCFLGYDPGDWTASSAPRGA